MCWYLWQIILFLLALFNPTNFQGSNSLHSFFIYMTLYESPRNCMRNTFVICGKLYELSLFLVVCDHRNTLIGTLFFSRSLIRYKYFIWPERYPPVQRSVTRRLDNCHIQYRTLLLLLFIFGIHDWESFFQSSKTFFSNLSGFGVPSTLKWKK